MPKFNNDGNRKTTDQIYHESNVINFKIKFTGKGAILKVPPWAAKHYWWIIILAAFLIVSWEVLELFYPGLHSLFWLEIILYLFILFFIGWMLHNSSKKINAQNEIMKVLDYKHKLSQELSICTDWDVLCDYIVRLPGTVVAVDQTHLFIANPITVKFERMASWEGLGHEPDGFDADLICQRYLVNFRVGMQFSLLGPGTSHQPEVYCLPIQYGVSLLGLVVFRMKPGRTLATEPIELFSNISDELAIALKIGQERRAFEEMSNTKAALDERRTVSHYLHDHLAQNIGYVHFKLGQLITETDRLSPEKMHSELERMREASRESYDIVRGTLETLNQQTTPLLTNLLVEHARKVAQRANFEIAFKTQGRPMPLESNVQRAVFYVFQETLSNVERHAQATKVDVRAEWLEDHFELSIQDNGVGFNPQAVNTDQHFGLEIMRERLAKVKGRVKLTVAQNSGTLVNVWVPTPSLSHLQVSNG
jgi:signal transduction histidine kinase